MKKFLIYIFSIITILSIFYAIIFYSIKIENVEQGEQGELIKIKFLNQKISYYYEY